MMDKQLKVHPGQCRGEGSGAPSRQASASLFLHTPDMETPLVNQRHGLEAVMAERMKLLEGATETSYKHPAQAADRSRRPWARSVRILSSFPFHQPLQRGQTATTSSEPSIT